MLEEKTGQGSFGEVWVTCEDNTGEIRAFQFCFKAERLRTLKREQTLLCLMQKTLGEREDVARLHDVRLTEEGSHSQIIQGDAMLRLKVEYIHNNPVRRGYVDAPEHWRWSSAQNYLRGTAPCWRLMNCRNRRR